MAEYPGVWVLGEIIYIILFQPRQIKHISRIGLPYSENFLSILKYILHQLSAVC